MPHYNFISGLRRSGSTLLAVILSQNSRFYAGMTRLISSLFNAALAQMSAGSEFGPVDGIERWRALLPSDLFTSFCKRYPDNADYFNLQLESMARTGFNPRWNPRRRIRLSSRFVHEAHPLSFWAALCAARSRSLRPNRRSRKRLCLN